MLTRRQRFRLYPNKEQEKKLFEARRLHCYLYNACIAHRRYEWKANKHLVSYFEQQNCLPEFKKFWDEFAALNSLSLQATVKRVDLAYNAFLQGLRKKPKFKCIREYSGWTYPSLPQKSGWKVESTGKHGKLTLKDLGITLKMRGKAKEWGKATTLTIVYKPGLNQWLASITVEIPSVEPKKVKPSQRCPECGTVHKEWAELSNRYHVCNNCRFEIERDKGSVLVMYNVATNKQKGLGTSLSDVGLSSSTSARSKRKPTGSMKQLGKVKRLKSQQSNREVGVSNFNDSKLG